MSAPYQPNIPIGNTKLSIDYQNIQTNFSELNTIFDVDHLPFDNTTAQRGYHTVVHLLNQSANPPNDSAAGQLYALPAPDYPAGGDEQLFYKTPAAGVMQLSGNFAAASEGFGWFSGILLQWGTVSSPGETGIVTFTRPFPNALFNVQLTYSRSATGGSSNHDMWVVSPSATPLDKTKFTYGGVSSGNTNLYWLAIGN